MIQIKKDIFLIKAQLLSQLNKYDEAVATVKEGRALNTKRFGANNPDLYRYDDLTAKILRDQGKYKESAMVYRNALDSMRALGAQDIFIYLELKSGLAEAYLFDRDHKAAVNTLLEAINEFEKAGNKGLDLEIKNLYLDLAQAYRFIPDYPASRKYLEKSESIIGPEATFYNWGKEYNFLPFKSFQYVFLNLLICLLAHLFATQIRISFCCLGK